MSTAKIRINLRLSEIEIEGSEEFVGTHSETIKSLFAMISNRTPIPKQSEEREFSIEDVIENGVPDNFGEYALNLPNTATDLEKVLLAGNFVQSKSADSSFTVKEVSDILLTHGMKPSNPHRDIAKNVEAKRIIKLAKGKFRISRIGTEHINENILAGKD